MMAGNDVRLTLSQRLRTLTARVSAVECALRAAHERDSTERAIERENDEVLERLDDAARAEAQMIRDALHRVETGQYGRCMTCERPIDAARLLAEPAATTCVTCAAGADAPRV